MTDFNLQQYLESMESNRREDHVRLEAKLDKVVDKVNDHETRLVVVETTRRAMIWLAGTAVAGAISVLYSLVSKLLS